MSSPSNWRFEWLKAVMQADGLPSTAKNIATVLSIQFANNETGRIDPSLAQMADYIKASPDTVKRAIRALVNAGWLSRTEGRGRGNYTSYTLCSPGKVISLSGQKRRANPPSEKGGKSAPLPAEKGAELRRKGGKSAPFHYKDKQSLEQKARATSQQPSPHLCAVVHRGSFHETDWNDWLADRGYPSLTEIGERSSDAGGTGWNMPWRSPPTAEDGTGKRIAENRVWWLVNRANERAESEVRYAAQ